MIMTRPTSTPHYKCLGNCWFEGILNVTRSESRQQDWQWYATVADLPYDARTLMLEQAVPYIQPAFLSAMENHHPHMKHGYMVLSENDRPVAIANLQLLEFKYDKAAKVWKQGDCVIDGLNLRWTGKSKLHVLVCGNTFLAGDHGLVIHPNADKPRVLSSVARLMRRPGKRLPAEFRKAEVIILKDFELTSDEQSIVERQKFLGIQTDPNMRLNFQPDWQSMDDYFGAMKSKFRSKAKTAYKKSDPLAWRDLSSDEIAQHLPEIKKLYQNVVDKAEFNLGCMRLESYPELKATHADDFLVRTFWLEDRFVGFMSGMKNNDTFDAHFVGMDYEFNREFAVYQRMLYTFVEIAFESGLRAVNFGRTASEIKSSLGAEPYQQICFTKLRNPFLNFVARPFIYRMKPKEPDLRKPFKTAA